MTDTERIEWLMADLERLNYVKEHMRTAEHDFDLRDAIDRLSGWSDKDLREVFVPAEDRRMRR
jgi:hypothetical protein